MFENKLILCAPKPSIWNNIATNPVLEKYQNPIWLPSIKWFFNLLYHSNRKTKGIGTIYIKFPFQWCIKHQNRISTRQEIEKTSLEVEQVNMCRPVPLLRTTHPRPYGEVVHRVYASLRFSQIQRKQVNLDIWWNVGYLWNQWTHRKV